MSLRKANRKSPPAGPAADSLAVGAADDPDGVAEPASLDAPGRRRLPPLLRLAWYSLNQAFRRRIQHLDLTPDQFTILRWLTECDPDWPTQRELGAMMASDPNTITSLLRRMEAAGFVERQPHETDRRANRIQITAAGKKVFSRARQVALDLQTEVLAPLPEQKRGEFFEMLEILAHACRQAVGGPGGRDED